MPLGPSGNFWQVISIYPTEIISEDATASGYEYPVVTRTLSVTKCQKTVLLYGVLD